jgi:nitrite reductase/ring-hydroxylating ferredoxin subunit
MKWLDQEPGIRVGLVRELEEGQRTVTTVGAHEILTVAVGGTFYAVDNRCSHSDGRLPLDNGLVYPETLELGCLWHAGRFSLVTGEATKRPCVLPIRTYEVVVHGDEVLVRLPAEPEKVIPAAGADEGKDRDTNRSDHG